MEVPKTTRLALDKWRAATMASKDASLGVERRDVMLAARYVIQHAGRDRVRIRDLIPDASERKMFQTDVGDGQI
jgi:hypothetical protein